MLKDKDTLIMTVTTDMLTAHAEDMGTQISTQMARAVLSDLSDNYDVGVAIDDAMIRAQIEEVISKTVGIRAASTDEEFEEYIERDSIATIITWTSTAGANGWESNVTRYQYEGDDIFDTFQNLCYNLGIGVADGGDFVRRYCQDFNNRVTIASDDNILEFTDNYGCYVAHCEESGTKPWEYGRWYDHTKLCLPAPKVPGDANE
jgi:hypothetical protein